VIYSKNINSVYIPKHHEDTNLEIQKHYVFCEVRTECLQIWINPIVIEFLFRAYGNSHFLSASNSGCHLNREYLCFSLSLITEVYILLLINMKDWRTNLTPTLLSIHALTLPSMLILKKETLKYGTWPLSKHDLINKHLKSFLKFTNSIDFDKL